MPAFMGVGFPLLVMIGRLAMPPESSNGKVSRFSFSQTSALGLSGAKIQSIMKRILFHILLFLTLTSTKAQSSKQITTKEELEKQAEALRSQGFIITPPMDPAFLNQHLGSRSNNQNKKSDYYIEIPQSFTKESTTGLNVDMKVSDKNGASIIVVLINFPVEYSRYSIWDILGNLDSYMKEFEEDGNEYMTNPRVLKYGKTTMGGMDTFWYDHTISNPYTYFKTYQTKRGRIVYTITFACPYSSIDNYSSIWFRVKNSFKF